ncbi:MAG TPA: hypothetical protein VN864_07490 [Thermoplasmata archaeon]|nr:hypothetical protein [Thermoplasmata archaeon]
MKLRRLAWLGPASLILLAFLPIAGATAPVNGLVTTCTSTASCSFVFNTSAGTGWAKTTASTMSFQLPGEALASYNLTYATYIGSLTGTYTYWTVGNFHGTDVNTGKVVYGTTDTNYTITCHGHSGRGGGCTYTYTTDNGTVVFHFTKAELTSTSVSCTPSSVAVGGGKTACTVTVTNLWNSTNFPTGKVHLASYGLGSFASKGVCTLSLGSCTLNWHPFDNTNGLVSIGATYPGSVAFYKSTGSTSVTVTGGG